MQRSVDSYPKGDTVDNPINDEQPVYAGCTQALLKQYLHPQDSWHGMIWYSTRSGIVGDCGWVNSLTPDFSSPLLTWSSTGSGIKLHALSALSLQRHRLGKQVLSTLSYRKYPLSSYVRRRSRISRLLIFSDSSHTVKIASTQRLHVTFHLHLSSLMYRIPHGARYQPKLPLDMYPGRYYGQFLYSLQRPDIRDYPRTLDTATELTDQIWKIAELLDCHVLLQYWQSLRSQELRSKVLLYRVLARMIIVL